MDKEQIEKTSGSLIDIEKIFMQLVREGTDNCDISYKRGDMEITFNFSITKIAKNGEVVVSSEEE